MSNTKLSDLAKTEHKYKLRKTVDQWVIAYAFLI